MYLSEMNMSKRTITPIDKRNKIEERKHGNKSHVNLPQNARCLLLLQFDILRFKLASSRGVRDLLRDILSPLLLSRELAVIEYCRHRVDIAPRLLQCKGG